jgi:hypothetical protein
MFALFVVFGVDLGHQHGQKEVRSKLGGNFLGYVKLCRGLPRNANHLSANQVGYKQLYTDRAVKKLSSSKQVGAKSRNSEQDDMKQLYRLLRDVQDQVATFFGHPSIPSRYLAIYVRETRLTSKMFPFIEEDKMHLITPKSVGETILKLLDGALYIDVMYEEDSMYAKEVMSCMGMWFRGAPVGTLDIGLDRGTPRAEALPAELEVFNFGGVVRRIKTSYSAYNLGKGLLKFPCLEQLKIDGTVQEVDFAGLAQLKLLSKLHLSTKTFDKRFCSLTKLTSLCVACNEQKSSLPTELGLMTNLRFLGLSGKITGCIPTELGLLGLEELSLCGNTSTTTFSTTTFDGSIPTELGLMTTLNTLVLQGKFSGVIPSELGLLTKLESLYLASPFLGPNIPNQLCELSRLEFLTLSCQTLQGCLPEDFDKLVCLQILKLDCPKIDTTRLDMHRWTQVSKGVWNTYRNMT